MNRLLFLFPLLILACTQPKANDDFSEKINPVKTAAHTQLPGTRIFARIPKNYTLVPSLIRLQKNNGTYLQVSEVPNASFASRKADLDKGLEAVKNMGMKIYAQKNFKYGPYDAFYMHSPDDNPKKDQVMLVFGDDHTVVIAVGVLEHNNTQEKKEALDFMLDLVLDPQAIPDYSAIQTYTIDNNTTDFKYAQNVSQVSFYTTSPEINATQDPFASQIMISSYPAMDSVKMQALGRSMIKRYESGGMVITPVNEGNTSVNGMPAYYIRFDALFKNRPSKCYQLVTGNQNGCVIFCGSAYENFDRYTEQFIAVAKTIRIKEPS